MDLVFVHYVKKSPVALNLTVVMKVLLSLICQDPVTHKTWIFNIIYLTLWSPCLSLAQALPTFYMAHTQAQVYIIIYVL
jgi:hypothetical protein